MGWFKNRMFEPSTIWAIWMDFSGSWEVFYRKINMMIRGGDCLENLHHQQYHLKPNQQTTNPNNPQATQVFIMGFLRSVSKKGGPRSSSLWFSIITWQLGSRLPLSLGHRSIRKLRPTYFHNPTSNCNTNLTTKLYGCFLKWWYLPKHPKKNHF